MNNQTVPTFPVVLIEDYEQYAIVYDSFESRYIVVHKYSKRHCVTSLTITNCKMYLNSRGVTSNA